MNNNKTKYDSLWSEEEFILTLDLYFKTRPNERDAKNKKILEVARLIGRTPASVVYRLGNYSAVDPRATLKGFDNGGKTVKRMFNKYTGDKNKLGSLANAIKEKAGHTTYKKGIDADAEATQIEVEGGKGRRGMRGTDGITDFLKRFGESEETLEIRLKQCEKVREEFIAKWSRDRLPKVLTLDSYVMGRGDTDNFCYWVERKTRLLGSILGATASKFKVYYDGEEKKYKWVRGFKSAEEAFKKTKEEIINILDAAGRGDSDTIKKNRLFKDSHLFRGKILFLYFPDKFLNVFAEDDIHFFLDKLGIEYGHDEHILDKQEKLLEFKNGNPEMRTWTNLKFGYFLYSQFNPPSKTTPKTFLPKKKGGQEEKDILAEEGAYVLPLLESIKLTEIAIKDIVVPTYGKEKRRKYKYKPNYIAASIQNKKLGDQGEEIVLKYEKEMLISKNRKDLAAKVKRVSLEDDSLGYDILSFTEEGKEKYIDVKATRAGVDNTMPFWLTDNERAIMENSQEKYFIYRVYSANTKTPKLLVIDRKLLHERFNIKAKLWEFSVA